MQEGVGGGWGAKPEGNREVRRGKRRGEPVSPVSSPFSGITLSLGVAGGRCTGLAGCGRPEGQAGALSRE